MGSFAAGAHSDGGLDVSRAVPRRSPARMAKRFQDRATPKAAEGSVTRKGEVMSAERMGRAGTTWAAGPALLGKRIRCCWAVALAGAFACNSEPEGEVRLATWWGQRGEFVAPFETLKQSLLETSGLDVRIVTELTSKGYHMQWV